MIEPHPAKNVSDDSVDAFGPWNPGLASTLPRELYPLATIFRPANVFTTVEQAVELRDLTGIQLHDLVTYRPERLALHELLIRVTADLSVPIGEKVEDLGINFRRMVNVILAGYLAPQMAKVTAAYDAARTSLAATITAEVSTRLFTQEAVQVPRRKGWLELLRGPSRVELPMADEDAGMRRAEHAIAAWRAEAHSGQDACKVAAYRALARVVAALAGRHGSVWGTPELIASIATSLACNDYGSDEIGRAIDPLFLAAAASEGYTVLPAQERPVIMNTKGPSAAGKSTLRPEQKALAERIGVRWSDFALISPDIWRKQLLDYGSLGTAYKYGGACTGEELHAIDQKLDRYMARKAARARMTHLLIDRFRFDSFAPDSDQAGSNLLTRFGRFVYMFFVITPPEALVVRAWLRALEVGRYKAVDDILAHNVEAYAGMPELFFTWALAADKDVHYEFLDNTVPFGERPRTVAFGWNGAMNVLDVKGLLDLERFQRVTVDARGPGELYGDSMLLAPEHNATFLAECVRRLPEVRFAEQTTGRIYLWMRSGRVAGTDPEALQAALVDPETRAGVLAVAPDIANRTAPIAPESSDLATVLGRERIHTLGRWGAGHESGLQGWPTASTRTSR